MANLEPIIQQVAIEGGGEAGSTLLELASVAETAFGRIAEAAEAASAIELLAIAPIAAIAAFAAAGFAIAKFTEIEAKAVLQEKALAEAFGTTRKGLDDLHKAFGGVDLTFLDRAIARTVTSVQNSQASINEAVRTSAINQEAAAEGIVDAQLNVQTAYNRSADVSKQWSLRLRSDALSIAEAYNKLSFASQDMSSQMTNDLLSVQSAALGLEQAQLKLSEFNSGTTDTAKEHDLQKQQLEQAVEAAQQRQSDAQLQQFKNLSEQPITQGRNQLGLEQAQFQGHQDLDQSFIDTAKAANDLAKSLTAAKAATEHSYETQLKDISSVLQAMRSGNASFLSDTSTEAKKRAVLLGTRQDFGDNATGKDVFQELHNLAQNSSLSTQELQSIVQSLVGGRHGGAEISQLVDAITKQGQIDFTKLPGTGEKTLTETTQNVKAQQTVDAIAVSSEKLHNTLEALASEFTDFTAWFAALPARIGSSVSSAAKGHAAGGEIRGPGTSTSDSIFARLSHGEFVMRSAAVQTYGTSFMHAINRMQFPGFAMGGPVSPSIRAPSIGPSAQGATLNLSIDGQQFNGLRAPVDVAKKLASFAVSRQTAATGVLPSWYK